MGKSQDTKLFAYHTDALVAKTFDFNVDASAKLGAALTYSAKWKFFADANFAVGTASFLDLAINSHRCLTYSY